MAVVPPARSETGYVPGAAGLPTPAARMKTTVSVPGAMTSQLRPVVRGSARPTTWCETLIPDGGLPFKRTAARGMLAGTRAAAGRTTMIGPDMGLPHLSSSRSVSVSSTGRAPAIAGTALAVAVPVGWIVIGEIGVIGFGGADPTAGATSPARATTAAAATLTHSP